MEIGKKEKRIVVEPLKLPMPQRGREAPDPRPAPKDPVKVPA